MLGPSFHATFMPERRYLTAILDYAAAGKAAGSMKEMSEETGIPMGESSGKQPAILRYAQAMGLVELGDSTVIRPVLTDFGRAVYEEDRFLGEELTQWLVHFNLCRGDIGAETWHYVFAKAMLGATFNKMQLEEYLVGIFGGKNRVGPMLVTYSDDAALARAGVLSVEGASIVRSKAPLVKSFAYAYSAYLLSLMEAFFSRETQVTVTDFSHKTEWFNVCFWAEHEIETALTMMADTGSISVDRQMRPWIIERRGTSYELWSQVWDDLA